MVVPADPQTWAPAWILHFLLRSGPAQRFICVCAFSLCLSHALCGCPCDCVPLFIFTHVSSKPRNQENVCATELYAFACIPFIYARFPAFTHSHDSGAPNVEMRMVQKLCIYNRIDSPMLNIAFSSDVSTFKRIAFANSSLCERSITMRIWEVGYAICSSAWMRALS